MNKTAKQVIEAGETTAVVDMAVEYNRQITALTKELDALKAALREKGVAQAALSGENNVQIEGTLGSAQVVMVKPAPKAKKGVDLLAAEANLPAETFAALFTKVTKVEIAEDYEAKVASLPTAQKAVLANLIEVVAQTPRVNLPK